MKTEPFSVTQMHPNRGYLHFNNRAFGFYVNNQIAPGIASGQPKKYSFTFGEFDDLESAYSFILFAHL